MKVWILLHLIPWEGNELIGIYETEAKAEIARKARNDVPRERDICHSIDEWEVQ